MSASEIRGHIKTIQTMTAAREQFLNRSEVHALHLVTRRLMSALTVVERQRHDSDLWDFKSGGECPRHIEALRELHKAVEGRG